MKSNSLFLLPQFEPVAGVKFCPKNKPNGYCRAGWHMGGAKMKTDFSLFIGVANAFIFEAIVFIAILVVWYGAERVAESAYAEQPGYTNNTTSTAPAAPLYAAALAN